MGVMGTTNISLNSAQQLFGAASGTQRNINDTNVRYLAGIPNSASGSQINMNKLSGAGYFTKSSAGTALNVRSDCVANGWNQTGPVWYIINGTVYSNSAGTASITISGSFPNGLILQINSGVIVTGFGGTGGAGVLGSSAPNVGLTGGVAIAVSGYTGGTLYIKNDGTIAGGGGGGASGGGGMYAYFYGGDYYAGGSGGGGSGFGPAGAPVSGQTAFKGSDGGIASGGAGGARQTNTTYTYASVAGGAGGGPGSAGTGTSHGQYGARSGGAAGACTTGTVAAGVVWLANGTRYGTIG